MTTSVAALSLSSLSFLAPGRLVLLLVPMLLAVAYLVAHARRRRYAVRLTTVEMFDQVAPDRPGWRRHVPAAALVAGVTLAALASARPAVATTIDEERALVVLAIDSSLSMKATDVSPSRLEAARVAAGDFLDSLPGGVAVGVVAFDGAARELIAPSTRLEAVRSRLDRIELGDGTAIGEAVFLGIDAIDSASTQIDQGVAPGADGAEPIGTIVVLSDGETTEGRPNDEAAAAAKAQGVTVHTIAFGTSSGVITDPLSGRETPVPVNPGALRDLAESTGGQAITAATASELSRVYTELGRSVQVERIDREVTDWFAVAAFALVAAASAGSLFWFGRLP